MLQLIVKFGEFYKMQTYFYTTFYKFKTIFSVLTDQVPVPPICCQFSTILQSIFLMLLKVPAECHTFSLLVINKMHEVTVQASIICPQLMQSKNNVSLQTVRHRSFNSKQLTWALVCWYSFQMFGFKTTGVDTSINMGG